MLVPFVIDIDSLEPDPTWSPSVIANCHRQLLDFWNREGLLLHDGSAFQGSRLQQAVASIPQKHRAGWLALLEECPPVPCPVAWDGLVNKGAIPRLCGSASLALVEDVKAEADFGVDPEEDEIELGAGPEQALSVCRIQSTRFSKVVQKAIEWKDRNVAMGEAFDAIWSARFRTLATIAPLKRIAIVDRYAIEQHFRCPQSQLSGLERFLRLLDQDAGGPRYVDVFSAWTKELKDRSVADIEQEVRCLVGRLPRGRVTRVVVHMVPNSVFSAIAHDRYVRFERYVWELGHGLDIFQGPAAATPCQASFKLRDKSHRDVEDELARRESPKAIKVLRGSQSG